ncbi:MAG: P27 family phage terminase small subunit [Ignavibacteriaceae bacterium]|nr:P27 family phage terminase small subunit [Ignavibacteriaceae bacterium]
MARHSQPNNIKALKGESRPERFQPDGIDTEKLEALPEPPQWWDVKTVEFFEKKGGQMIAHRMLSILDIEYLEMYCLLYCKMVKLWCADEAPSMAMYTQLNSFAAQLGLNPISRQKFKVESGDKKGNKYAKSKPKK